MDIQKEIPPKFTGAKWRSGPYEPCGPFRLALMKLDIGEFLEWDRKYAEKNAYMIAQKIGISITLRRLGKEKTVTIYRVS